MRGLRMSIYVYVHRYFLAEELGKLFSRRFLSCAPGQTSRERPSILSSTFPKAEEKYLIESLKNYPVAINGKTRTELKIALDATQQQVEEIVLTDLTVKKWLEGKQVKKLIYVRGKMINIVL